jgi:hypothetical protein
LDGGGLADCCDADPDAGGDCAWLEVPVLAGACEVVVELFAGAFEPADWFEPEPAPVAFCVDVPVEGDVAWFDCDEVDGWFCVFDDLSGFFEGVLVGDCAYAAVANAMPIAVVANKRILIACSCFEFLRERQHGLERPVPVCGRNKQRCEERIATSVVVSVPIKLLEIFEGFDDYLFRIGGAGFAALADEAIERCPPFVVLVDLAVDQSVDAPGALEGESGNIATGHLLPPLPE